MFNPVSTYRIQFHKDFTFLDFEKIIPYLHQLGIKTIYASPVFEATPGSTHGYDGVNPHRINPEIGDEAQLRKISAVLKEFNISWIQDIVPNHMAFHENNLWLMDVMEKGKSSSYSEFFDILWENEAYEGRLMVPFLGGTIDEVLEKGELNIIYKNNKFCLSYYNNYYPLNTKTYTRIFEPVASSSAPIQKLLEELQNLKHSGSSVTYAMAWQEILLQLSSLMKEDVFVDKVKESIRNIVADKEQFLEIIQQQSYQLCHWQETDVRINYRRFFTINGLICLNIHLPHVFEEYHRYIKTLVDEGVFQGLRVDHIDGLYDPTSYLDQLRELAGENTYIVVEKILEPKEELPQQWLIQGNTGYDFLSLSNNLLTPKANEQLFSEYYEKLIGTAVPVSQQIYEKKAYILKQHMNGELENLYHLLLGSGLISTEQAANAGKENLKEAIAEFLIECPVYRYYGNKIPLGKEEFNAVKKIFDTIKERKGSISDALDILENIILFAPNKEAEDYKHKAQHFYMRCMQFTGPLMAKGVEDTLMYTYSRSIGHNEVGDAPYSFGLTKEDFHQKMVERQKYWPLSLNATATHDTKRGEDVSARLNVLTSLGDKWIQISKQWLSMVQSADHESLPDVNDQYFIYQTLLATTPFLQGEEDRYIERLGQYFSKAFREAKVHSNWTSPNEKYETAARAFVDGLVKDKKLFRKSFDKLEASVADFGIINSLLKVLLKYTCPGVPDLYQGCELWDLSLVDPDNRRPVDYGERIKYLQSFDAKSLEQEHFLTEIWDNRKNGGIKLWLIHQLLKERKANPDIFSKGYYIPLEVEGKYKENILAFARRYQNEWYIVAAPLHMSHFLYAQRKNIENFDWKNTRVILPPEAPDEWTNVLYKGSGNGHSLLVKELFQSIPVAFLKLDKTDSARGAGVLLHITSLPSKFGIGDLGTEARAFASFLSRSNQKYWQLLPLNPTGRDQGYSPYSSNSSRAGNTLLISLDLLVKEGLLEEQDLEGHYLASAREANFTEAEEIKNILFQRAYENFNSGNYRPLKHQFSLYILNESDWLNDYAVYVVLKEHHDETAWFQWPEEYKVRQREALQSFETTYPESINKVKWLQFIFSRQWKGLKTYCNNLGIKLFGDLPFYISYDSVDVWSHQEIFSLDKEGNMLGVAGVPPDYFNSNGQLWGMPVFRWDVLKSQHYKWWVERVKKNMELYDLLRLDHFRAFADYWEVPAEEKTAINGVWKEGPGKDFFDSLERQLGKLPFIAEDLGDISDIVIELREATQLPGMKVLQFAFGNDIAQSTFIPHNYSSEYVVYTGTHDNNTTVGWFRESAGRTEKGHLEKYTGTKVSESNIHLVLARMAYGSVAKIAILPAQDLLGLDEKSRMNIPSSIENNWQWRLTPGALNNEVEKRLREWTKFYNRK